MTARARRIPKPVAAATTPVPDPDDVSTAELEAIGAALSDVGWALIFLKDVVNRMKRQRAIIETVGRDAERLRADYAALDARVCRLFEAGMSMDSRRKRLREITSLYRRWRQAALDAGHPDPSNPEARRSR